MTTWLINGTPLTSVAQRIETGEDLWTTPGVVGVDVASAGADGAIDPYAAGQRRRPDAPGRWRPHLWIKGVDPVGGWVGVHGSEQTYLDNVDAAVRMFHARPLVIDAVRPDGSVRRAVGHLAPGETLDFTRQRTSPAFGQYLPSVVLPGAHWVGLDTITVGPLTLASGAHVDLSAFAQATAPCTELIIDIGPCTNPYLTWSGAPSAGKLGWQGVIASGRTLRINTATPAVFAGPGTNWTPSYQPLDYSPGPRYFEIDPSGGLDAVLTFSGASTTTLTISGYPRYRTA